MTNKNDQPTEGEQADVALETIEDAAADARIAEDLEDPKNKGAATVTDDGRGSPAPPSPSITQPR